jgi:predicted CXXCH cytochrome family protein
MCHDDIGVAASEAAAPHAAMEVARCADCHNAHASPHDRLLKLPAGGVCLDCHGDQAAGEGEQIHGVIDLIGCRACHEPHGGGQEKLLRVTGPDLCLACHDPNRVPGGDGAAAVRLLGRFDVPPEAVRRMTTLRLTAGGQEGHPVPGHRVLGEPTTDELRRGKIEFEGEMTCLTCHDPHKGRSGGLLRWNAASSTEACAQCHER